MINVIEKAFNEFREIVKARRQGKIADDAKYISKIRNWASNFSKDIKESTEAPEESETEKEKTNETPE